MARLAMCENSALIGFFAGVVSGILVEFLGHVVMKYWTRPRLRVSFDQSNSSCVAETFTAGNTQCHYLSVAVENYGRTTARNFRGFLVGMERRNEQGAWIPFARDVIQLNWAFTTDAETGTGYDLMPGVVPRYLNVFFVDASSPVFQPTVILWPKLPNRWNQHLVRQGRFGS
jgi:hypothetical protein